VRGSLAHVLGAEFETTWTDVCREVPIDPAADTIVDAEFERLITLLAERGSTCRVIAMSWKIRRTAARKLAALGR
jgi:hypothetical protein